MIPWSEFAEVEPDLAAFGAGLLHARPAYLATLRADVTPRVHPVTPILTRRGLFVFMEPTSPKGRDLRERNAYSLHTGVPDNQGTGGEFRVSGNGRSIDDSTVRSEVAAASSYEPAERYVLFELLVKEAFANAYGDVALPENRRWRAIA